MFQPAAIHFDTAAFIVMLVTLASFALRRMTKGAVNRVYLSAMILVTITTLASLGGELYDAAIAYGVIPDTSTASGEPPIGRDAFTLVYYALRSLTAPIYLVLIAAISGTTHRLNANNFVRICLWGPMIAVLLLVLTNPVHHLVYYYLDGVVCPGQFIYLLYVNAAYYSAIGITWLFHWRSLLNKLEFYTLLCLYPIVFVALVIHIAFPEATIDMFVTSITMMLISAFVIRPEVNQDSSVNAASLQAYREMCFRAFESEKSMCLVYLEIVNLERLRELVGKDELQDIVKEVAANLSSRLGRDDVLYYLRTGLFCIAPRNSDPERALHIAQRAHEEGKAKSIERRERTAMTEMRTCIVRVPEDVHDLDTLKTFVQRFGHLVPGSCVTTYSELSQQEGFELEMAMSDIIARAIENKSFEMHYQPIWHVESGKARSAEALARLYDPEFGWISPSRFIPEAEQNGTILEIGQILLSKVCTFLGTIDFEATGLEYVEVNLSIDQCVHPMMVPNINAVIEKHGIDPSRINFEITETSSTYSQQAISENMRLLTEEGFSFSLDDYGVGYSSMTRMLDLPFSLIKFDRSFVLGLDDPIMHKVLGDSIAMIKAVGRSTLIEGIETQEQADELVAMGVDYIQGFRFSTPLSEDEFIEFLREHNS